MNRIASAALTIQFNWLHIALNMAIKYKKIKLDSEIYIY